MFLFQLRRIRLQKDLPLLLLLIIGDILLCYSRINISFPGCPFQDYPVFLKHSIQDIYPVFFMSFNNLSLAVLNLNFVHWYHRLTGNSLTHIPGLRNAIHKIISHKPKGMYTFPFFTGDALLLPGSKVQNNNLPDIGLTFCCLICQQMPVPGYYILIWCKPFYNLLCPPFFNIRLVNRPICQQIQFLIIYAVMQQLSETAYLLSVKFIRRYEYFLFYRILLNIVIIYCNTYLTLVCPSIHISVHRKRDIPVFVRTQKPYLMLLCIISLIHIFC